MKKIFTLLFAVGIFAMAQAQPGSRENRQNDQRNDQRYDQRNDQQNDQGYDQRNDQQNDQRYDQRNDQRFDQRDFNKGYDKGRIIVETNDYFERGGRYNDRFFMERRRDMKIARINQEYDYKIQRVRRDFYMSWFEKQRLMRFLDNQRRWEISMVYERFNDYCSRDRFHGSDVRSNGHY